MVSEWPRFQSRQLRAVEGQARGEPIQFASMVVAKRRRGLQRERGSRRRRTWAPGPTIASSWIVHACKIDPGPTFTRLPIIAGRFSDAGPVAPTCTKTRSYSAVSSPTLMLFMSPARPNRASFNGRAPQRDGLKKTDLGVSS